jgi:endonuclease/exonuclease/phosphatase family metal-dependent hydrolase
MKQFLRILLGILLAPVLAFGLFLLGFTLLDYRPDAQEEIELKGNSSTKSYSDTLSILTWNMGYGGLGAEQDFFFDGGLDVRPNAKMSAYYLNGILGFLASQRGVDVLMLQEVDKDSRRSYYTDQEAEILKALPGYASSFAYNYKTLFVPEPLDEPYGKCMAGLMTLGRVAPAQAIRHALAPDADWPVGLFMLDRCFISWRYPAYFSDGTDLILLNLHLSAYDDGHVKKQQMDSLEAYLRAEYALGNRIVAGGDWNQLAPGSPGQGLGISVPVPFPDAGWNWAAAETSTNRDLITGYQPGITRELTIDFFLLSPNLKAVEVKGLNQSFAFSDHEPVLLRVCAK